MKNFLPAILSLLSISLFGQGNNCTNAIPFIFDGAWRSYNFTSTLDSSYYLCGYDGIVANVVWFKLTTGGIVQPMEIEMKVQGSPLECIVYNNHFCAYGNILPYQNLCMDDGNGVWGQERTVGAPAQSLQPNTTYYFKLRPISGFTGQVSVSAKFSTNFNYTCNTAMVVNGVVWDNNASAPNDSAEITPQQVCATTLENTKWYKHTRNGNNDNVFAITAIDCDNFESAVNGYQVGMFTGACGAIVYQNICFAAPGGTVNFPINQFPIGTDIWFALDGNIGANCKYMVGIFPNPLAVDSSGRPIRPVRAKPYNFKVVNPVHDQLIFYYYSTEAKKGSIVLTDNVGKAIRIFSTTIPKGNSYNHVNISGLPKGVYYATFLIDENQWTEKLIKM